MTGQDRTDEPPKAWRVTGAGLWLPALMLGLFVLQALARLYSLVLEPPPHLADGILLTLALVGSAAGAAGLVVARRTRVVLTPVAIDVRRAGHRLIPYSDVERAYRNRWSRGAVTLDLLDGTTVVLPAPVANLKDPAPELDEAVEEINARVAAARPGVSGPG